MANWYLVAEDLSAVHFRVCWQSVILILGTIAKENLNLKNILANNNLLGNLPLTSILNDGPLASIMGSFLGENNGLSGGLSGKLPLVGNSPLGNVLESTPIGGLVEDSPVSAVLGGPSKLLGDSDLVGGRTGGLSGKLPLAGNVLESTPIGGLVENSPVSAVRGALGGGSKLLGGSGLVGGLLGKKNGKRHLVEGTSTMINRLFFWVI